MNMALEGATREQIQAKLAAEYDLADADGLIGEVLTLAGR
jgi:hypothetical protein